MMENTTMKIPFTPFFNTIWGFNIKQNVLDISVPRFKSKSKGVLTKYAMIA